MHRIIKKFGVYLVFIFTDKHQFLLNDTKKRSLKNAFIKPNIKHFEILQKGQKWTSNQLVVGSNPTGRATLNPDY